MLRRFNPPTLLLAVMALAAAPPLLHAAPPATVHAVAAVQPHDSAPAVLAVDSLPAIDSLRVAALTAHPPTASDSMVRAKFYVSKLEEYPGSSTNVGLKPVMAKWDAEKRQYEDSENKQFWDATPSGDITLSINNGAAAAFFKAHLGKEVYVDFTPVETPAS